MARKTDAPKTTTAKRTLTEDDLKRLPWRSIGPATMGGRASDLCFEPGNAKAFLVGYASGGLWRTTNRGTTFEPIFDKEETSSIGSVVWCAGPKSAAKDGSPSKAGASGASKSAKRTNGASKTD